MKLSSCPKVIDARAVTPEETVSRLTSAIGDRYAYRFIEEQVDTHLHWSALFVDELGFRAMGKGTSRVLSQAGALAEAGDWLTRKESDRLPGYMTAHEDDVGDPHIGIADLVNHVATATPAVLDRIRNLTRAQYWADGWSLIHNRTVTVPLEYARVISGPNGLAAGNRIEEAVLHAMNEIFERRAQITVLRNRMVVPTIDIATIEHPVIREQLAFLRERDIAVTLKDLSFGGVLPCIGVYLRDPHVPDTYQFHHFFKVGASFDRELALQRALTEYVQGRRRDEFLVDTSDAYERLVAHDFRALRCQADDTDNFLSAFMFGFVPGRHARFLELGETVPFDRGNRFDDCLDDIRQALGVCRLLGKDCIAIDLTDPAIGFPVVQVMIPGYSDVLPFHPASSPGLFRCWTRDEVLRSYNRVVTLPPEPES